MRRGLKIGAVGAAGLACAAALSTTATGHHTAAVCSSASATQAVSKLHVAHPYVYTALCGAFAGPGSRAMAATTGQPPGGNNCLGVLNGWFVFREVGGVWQPVPGGVHYPVPIALLKRSGDDLVERDLIHLPNAPHCDISGFQERTWHWNGSRLVATPFQYVLPTGTVDNFNWFSPDRRVWCTIFHIPGQNEITCATRTQNAATLKHTGVLRICDHPRNDVCIQNWGSNDSTPVLQPTQQLNINGFRCSSQPSAVSCVVATGAARGKGFRLTSAGEVTKL